MRVLLLTVCLVAILAVVHAKGVKAYEESSIQVAANANNGLGKAKPADILKGLLVGGLITKIVIDAKKDLLNFLSGNPILIGLAVVRTVVNLIKLFVIFVTTKGFKVK